MINQLIEELTNLQTASDLIEKVYNELILFRNTNLTKETTEQIEYFVEYILQNPTEG